MKGHRRVVLLHEAFKHVLFSSLAQNISRTLTELSCTLLPCTNPSFTAGKNMHLTSRGDILNSAHYVVQ